MSPKMTFNLVVKRGKEAKIDILGRNKNYDKRGLFTLL
jgi:hypothetical protein